MHVLQQQQKLKESLRMGMGLSKKDENNQSNYVSGSEVDFH